MEQKHQYNKDEENFDYLSLPKGFPPGINSPDKLVATIRPKAEAARLSAVIKRSNIKVIEDPLFSQQMAINFLGLAPTEESYILIDFGATSTRLCGIYNKKIVFNRALNTGGINIDKAIASYCKIDLTKARKIKNQYGLSKDTLSDEILNAHNIITSSLEKLIADIQYSIKYYCFQVTKSRITNFEKIILSGSLASMNGFREMLNERLGQECFLADFSTRLEMPRDKSINDLPPLSSLTDVFGLGFWDENIHRSLCTNTNNKKEKASLAFTQKISSIFFSLFILVVIASVLVVSALAYSSFMKKQTLQLETNLETLNMEIKNFEFELEEQNQVFNSLRSSLASKEKNYLNISQEIHSLENFHFKSYHLSDMFKLFSENTPDNIKFTNIYFNTDYLDIKGIADKHNSVSNLMSIINRSPQFEDCRFQYSRVNKETGNVEFHITANKAVK